MLKYWSYLNTKHYMLGRNWLNTLVVMLQFLSQNNINVYKSSNLVNICKKNLKNKINGRLENWWKQKVSEKQKLKISWEGVMLLAIVAKGIQINSYNENNQKN